MNLFDSNGRKRRYKINQLNCLVGDVKSKQLIILKAENLILSMEDSDLSEIIEMVKGLIKRADILLSES
ncbi:MAG: hypothetical protein JEZ07_16125 [Phycisphaerae bacterium]|nr:hypothetical protein [Phycisphaerae bacterium]